MSSPIPIPDLNLGGDSGPALSETGSAAINQGGLNVPAYPYQLVNQPVDNDSLFISNSKSEDLTLYYAAAGALLVLILAKIKK